MPRPNGPLLHESPSQARDRKTRALQAIKNSATLKFTGKLDQNQVATLMGFRTSWSSNRVPAEVRKIMQQAAQQLDLELEQRYHLKKTKTGMEPDINKPFFLVLHRKSA